MSAIQSFLDNILSSRYGKDVRQSIHDAIKTIDNVADGAKVSATASATSAAESASKSAESAKEAKGYAEQAKESAESLEFPVSIENGGTGATTAKEAQYNLLNDMVDETASPITDNVYIPCLYVNPTKEKGVLNKRGANVLWNYIKSKISSVLGLTDINYTGTAAKATADESGNTISSTYATKTEVTPVANLLATETGSPLDATMGKALDKRISALEDSEVKVVTAIPTDTLFRSSPSATTGTYASKTISANKGAWLFMTIPETLKDVVTIDTLLDISINNTSLYVAHWYFYTDEVLCLLVANNSHFVNESGSDVTYESVKTRFRYLQTT